MSAPLLNIGNRNLIINSGGHFWQRWATTSNTLAAPAFFSGDRFLVFGSGTTGKNCTVSQSTNVPSAIAGRAQFSFQLVSTSNFTPTGNDRWTPFVYQLEGNDYAPWHQGKKMALTFYMWAPIAGDYSVYLTNIDGSRRQVRVVNIAAGEVNSWVRKTILFESDTTGTWNLNNLMSLELGFFSVATGTHVGGALSNWTGSSTTLVTPSCVNWAATNGNTIRLAGVHLHGYSGKYYEREFEIRGHHYNDELALCQRYFEKSYGLFTNPGSPSLSDSRTMRQSGADTHFIEPFKVQKRITPTITIYHPSTGAANQALQADGAGSPAARSAVGSGNDHGISDINITGAPDVTALRWHWAANADIA